MEEKWWKGSAELLESKNPELFQALNGQDFPDVEFCKSKNGELNLKKRFKGKEVYLHSEENPTVETTEWLLAQRNNITGREICFLFGIGLGYVYEAMREWLWNSPNRKLIVFEDDLGVIKRFLETENGYRFLDDKQTALIAIKNLESIGPQLHEVLNGLLPVPFRLLRIGVLCDSFNLKYRKEEMVLFYARVRGQYEIALQKAEWLAYTPTLVLNAMSNLYQLAHAKNIKSLLNTFKGMPAIVCGGGPSIDEQVEQIRNLENRALIIAVGAGINVLSHYGIKPHLCCGIDPNLINFSRFLTHTAFEVPLVFTRRLYREIAPSMQSPLIHMGTTKRGCFTWFEEKLGSYVWDESVPVVSVGNEGVVLAKSLGCTTIALVGINLSSREGVSYGHGVINHPLIECSSDFSDFARMQFLHSPEESKQSQTTMQFMQEWIWFSEYAKQNSEIKLLNASVGGLDIAGIESSSLKEIMDKHMVQTHDIRGMLHAAYVQSAGYSLEKIHQLAKEWKNLLDDATDLCEKLVEAYQCDEPTEDLVKKLRENGFYEYQLSPSESVFQFALNMKEKFWGLNQDNSVKGQKFAFLLSKCLEYQKNFEIVRNRRKTREQRDWQKFPAEHGVGTLKNGQTHHEMEKGTEKRETYYPSGKVKQVESIKGKQLHGRQYIYSEEGNILYESHYHEGNREGQTLMYYPSGALYAVLNYSKGKENGEQKYFYESGAPRSVINYKEGVLEGTAIFYYPDGDLKRQQSFHQGMRTKIERLWTEHAFLRYQMEWRDGKPLGSAKMWNEEGNFIIDADFGEGEEAPHVINWDDNKDETDQIKQMKRGMGELEGDMHKALNAFANFDWSQEALNTFEKEKGKLEEAFEQLKEITNRLKRS